MNSNLVNIIRFNLNAAQAALDLLAYTQPGATVAVKAAPMPTDTAVQPPVDNAFVAEGCEQFSEPLTSYQILLKELNDPRYTLRSTRELSEKTGIDYSLIPDLLDENNVLYVTKRRRSDGAELIGLDSRN